MILVGIDPGTTCGWSVFSAAADGGEERVRVLVSSGTWDLRPRRHESSGVRFLKFRTSFTELLAGQRPGLVAYEEVRRHIGVDAAHVYGGILSVLQMECLDASVEYMGIHYAHVKRAATGKGNAKKEAVLSAARARFGEHVTDDNEADALFVAWAALDQLGR